jgi:hypothetical protein
VVDRLSKYSVQDFDDLEIEKAKTTECSAVVAHYEPECPYCSDFCPYIRDIPVP